MEEEESTVIDFLSLLAIVVGLVALVVVSVIAVETFHHRQRIGGRR